MNSLTIVLLVCIVVAITTIGGLAAYSASLRNVIRQAQRQEEQRQAIERSKITLPIRLQAYERLALLLERISPESLLLRVDSQGADAKAYEALLLETIRTEWSHNLSQQIYVSHEVWTLVKSARGQVSKLITLSGEKMHPDSPASELSRTLLSALLEMETHPTALALQGLRDEAQQLF